MGWLSWSSSSSSSDAVNQLDDDLQAFVNSDLSPSTKKQKDQPRLSNTRASPIPPTLESQVKPVDRTEKNVPVQSAFQDGRYADLWKTYRPIESTEAAVHDHSSRLQSLSHAHRIREQRVGEVAAENCVMEAQALANCYKVGKTADLFTMCAEASRAKTSCIEMQTKFLRALGFMATSSQVGDAQDRIQIHADRLYRQMVDNEREIETAIKEGREPPAIQPIMSRENVTAVLRSIPVDGPPLQPTSFDQVLQLDEKQRVEYENAIQNKTADQIALLQREIEGESLFRLDGTAQVNQYLDIERRERAARKAAGQTRLGDYILNWWGYNPGPDSK